MVKIYDIGFILVLLALMTSSVDAMGVSDSTAVLEAAVETSPKNGAAWVRLGQAYLNAGDLKGARKAFWKGARGPHQAAAFNGLGLTYLQDARPFKLKALEFFRRAVGADAEFTEARMNIARLHVEMGNSDAEAALNEVIEADSSYAVQALYWAGWHKVRQAAAFLEGEKAEGMIRTASFGRQSRSEAMAYLRRALRIDPDHRPSLLLLGAVYYDARMARRMVALFEDYLKRNPEDREVRFYIGLGYEAQEDVRRAYRAYEEGAALMASTEQAFVGAIIKEDAGVGISERCWQVRDPIFLTPVNERLMEHYRRVAYANLRFGDANRSIEGWTTDKGRAYIRYGEPIYRYGMPYQKERWVYGGFGVVFSYAGMGDRWRLQKAWIGRREMEFEELVSRVPEVYKDPFRFKRYHMPYQVAQFRGEADSTRVEVYYAIPGEEVEHRRAEVGVEAVDLRQGLFLFNDECEPMRRQVARVTRLPWVVYDAIREGYLYATERLALRPGTYFLAGEIEDEKAEAFGVFRDSLEVRGFGYDSLAVSSLLLARRIEEVTEGPFGRERFRILPEPLKECTEGGQLQVYFEVYNLTRDRFGGTHYKVTYQIQVLSDERGVGGPEWSTAVTQALKGTRDWAPHHVTLDVSAIPPGPRALRVVVVDLRDGEQAVVVTDFRVVR